MTRATDSVGSRFASLPLALVHPRNAFQPRWLVTNHSSLITTHCLSNRNKVRIQFAVTHSKQKTATISNRNSFRGPGRRGWGRKSHLCGAGMNSSRTKLRDPRRTRALVQFPTACADSIAQSLPCSGSSSLQLRASSLQQAKKKLIATHPNSKFALTPLRLLNMAFSNRNKIRVSGIVLCAAELRQGQEKNAGWKPALRGPESLLNPPQSLCLSVSVASPMLESSLNHE
jgi:hypothetical protein